MAKYSNFYEVGFSKDDLALKKLFLSRFSSREVWCERSDGLKVDQGCNSIKKPSEVETCRPSCTVRNSYCNKNVKCVCKKNYVAIMSSSRRLLRCITESNWIEDTNGKPNNDIPAQGSKGKEDSGMYVPCFTNTRF